jgi:hypothetical protein
VLLLDNKVPSVSATDIRHGNDFDRLRGNYHDHGQLYRLGLWRGLRRVLRWINSQLGSYRPDQSLVGKATFGFVSKYKKGATIPEGETEFQFHVASLNFHSTVYEWLVVSGAAKAQYKGSGACRRLTCEANRRGVIPHVPTGRAARSARLRET